MGKFTNCTRIDFSNHATVTPFKKKETHKFKSYSSSQHENPVWTDNGEDIWRGSEVMTTSRNRNKVESFELNPLPLLRHGMSPSEMHVIVIQHHTHISHGYHICIYTVIICYINRYHWQPKAKHSDKSPQLSSFLSKVLLVDWGDKVSGVAIFIGSSVGSKGLQMKHRPKEIQITKNNKNSQNNPHLTGGEKSKSPKIVKNHPIFSATTKTTTTTTTKP